MGIFDFFFKKPEVKKPAAKIAIEEDTEAEFDYLLEMRKKRLAEYKPVISRGDMKDSPNMKTEKFRLTGIPVATMCKKYTHYLLDGDNAESFIKDMEYINSFVRQANEIVPGLPDMFVRAPETAFAPVPSASAPVWIFSKLCNEGTTPTWKQKKYPLSIIWETISEDKRGRFFYDENGILGKGWVYAKSQSASDKITAYTIDFISGKLSHVWAHFEDIGKKAIYNKNDVAGDGND